ncbi:hypothetical protein HXX76_016232 [Chlamydomonas incerta]|uniref:Uncharacterized protein n=1 Tax=Chlamydomonas incerta TaxID=51695 RepID=A0A835SAT0_CHLIN|nr:hypothetical protein HXX76_016232 [Chlamydomonas incerta]|eukprot:KAG2422176.1 hypothetical protein HXX76_016232 [Chlamydomonas incerta]
MQASADAYNGSLPWAIFNCTVRANTGSAAESQQLREHHLSPHMHNTALHGAAQHQPGNNSYSIFFDSPDFKNSITDDNAAAIIREIQKQADNQNKTCASHAHKAHTDTQYQRFNPHSTPAPPGGLQTASVQHVAIPTLTPASVTRSEPGGTLHTPGALKAISTALADNDAKGRRAQVQDGQLTSTRRLLGPGADNPNDFTDCFVWQFTDGTRLPLDGGHIQLNTNAIHYVRPPGATLALVCPTAYDAGSVLAACWLTAGLNPTLLRSTDPRSPGLHLRHGGRTQLVTVGVHHRSIGESPYLHVGGVPGRVEADQFQRPAATVVLIRNLLVDAAPWAGLDCAIAAQVFLNRFIVQAGIMLHHSPAELNIQPPAPAPEAEYAAGDVAPLPEPDDAAADDAVNTRRGLGGSLAAAAAEDTSSSSLAAITRRVDALQDLYDEGSSLAGEAAADLHVADVGLDMGSLSGFQQGAAAARDKISRLQGLTTRGQRQHSALVAPFLTAAGAPEELQSQLERAENISNHI